MGGFAAMEVSLISAMVERSAPRMSIAHDRAGFAVRLMSLMGVKCAVDVRASPCLVNVAEIGDIFATLPEMVRPGWFLRAQ
jgi:hypothetical protein